MWLSHLERYVTKIFDGELVMCLVHGGGTVHTSDRNGMQKRLDAFLASYVRKEYSGK